MNMVSQATKTREVTFQDIPKQAMFYDLCGCLYRKTGDLTGTVLNLCVGCKITAVIDCVKPLGKEVGFISIDRVTPANAGPVRTASPQPTEPQVEEKKETIVYKVVRLRMGNERCFGYFAKHDDASTLSAALREDDQDSNFIVEPVLVIGRFEHHP
jgi:hypothetical protein